MFCVLLGMNSLEEPAIRCTFVFNRRLHDVTDHFLAYHFFHRMGEVSILAECDARFIARENGLAEFGFQSQHGKPETKGHHHHVQ